MRNELIIDWKGNTDSMVIFTPGEIGLASRINGKNVKEYWISKYQNTIINGIPYSAIHQRPAVNIDKETARKYCCYKGAGWHLMTNEEWDAIVRLSKHPTGNTDCGRSIIEHGEIGILYKGSLGKTLTGSGPIAWNHDRTRAGIADMCGNVYEFVDGTIVNDRRVISLDLESTLSEDNKSPYVVVRGGSADSGISGEIESMSILPAKSRGEMYGFRSARVIFEED